MIAIFCGDRNWNNFQVIEKTIESFCITKMIEGDCRGADKISGWLGRKKGIEVIREPADWTKYGPRAGPIRNRKMLTYKPDITIAFHDNIEQSKGTKDMINASLKANVKVFLIHSNGVCNKITTKFK